MATELGQLLLTGLLGFGLPATAQTQDHKCFTDPGRSEQTCVGQPRQSRINFSVNLNQQRISAHARLDFTVSPQARKVYFFLDPQVQTARLNGKIIASERRRAPGGEDWILVLPLTTGTRSQSYQLELSYDVTGLTSWGLSWQPFHWRTDYSDSTDARFSNAFAPSSFEADRYPMSWSFSFTGLTAPLAVYTSASGIQRPDDKHLSLNFDAHTQVSAPYFELSSQRYATHSYVFQGRYQPIPVRIYLDPAISQGPGLNNLFKEARQHVDTSLSQFEQQLGPYAFPELLVKVYSLQTGDLPLAQEYSMEYGGAIVSRMELIPHEICHQWFGRGAAPADGQTGFVDEVICDWYDYGRPVKKQPTLRKTTRLSPQNAWTLRTPPEAYQEGMFMAELSARCSPDSDKLVQALSSFYRKHRQSSYTRTDFVTELDQACPGDLAPFFRRYLDGGETALSPSG